MNCIICESHTETIRHPKYRPTYHLCSNCGFISKSPDDYLTEEAEYQEYENHENSIDDPRYVAYFEKFLQAAVFPFVGEGRSALDFGSGPVPVLSKLMERDYGYQFMIYDKFYAQDKSYQDQTFDLITTTEVVEHVTNPMETFRELANLLKPNGILAVMTLFPSNDLEKFFGWHYMREPTHVSFFTEKAMEIIAERVGLQIIYCDHKRYTTFKKQ